MIDETKRPASVWITQILLGLAILLGVGFLIMRIFQFASCYGANGLQKCLTMGTLLKLSGECILILLLLLAFWGLQKRKYYGRWMGIIFLIMLIFEGVTGSHYFQLIYNFIILGEPLPAPPYDCWEQNAGIETDYCGYSSYIELLLFGAKDIFFPSSLFGFLAIRLGSSKDVKRYFKQGRKATS